MRNRFLLAFLLYPAIFSKVGAPRAGDATLKAPFQGRGRALFVIPSEVEGSISDIGKLVY